MNVLPAVRAWLLGLCLTTPGVHALTCTNASITPSNPDANYTVNADDTVTHKPTGLVWKRCSEGQSWNGNTCSGTPTTHTWAQALTLAKNSSFAGQSDWRMPNLKELRSLVEECRINSAINESVFPGTLSLYYLSGSPYFGSSNYAWGVHFGGGLADQGTSRSNRGRVRLVRGGQSFSLMAPSCTLSANPSSITAGDRTTLTAQCSPTAASYVWTGGSCAGANASASCITSPVTTTSYSVAGVNAVGIGPAASVTVTVSAVATVPGAPLGLTATAGDRQVNLNFHGPLTDGGAPISGYVAQCIELGSAANSTAQAANSPLTVTGLSNGQTYNCSVRAVNSVGQGVASATVSVTPMALGLQLAVTLIGTGSGAVTSDVGGIQCNSTAGLVAGSCSTQLPSGSLVTLTATPALGSSAPTWMGCDSLTSDTPPKCKVTMDAAKTVEANFAVSGCEGSSVATITANGYAYADKYQAFDVMCQSGRYGVVRLPQWYLPGLLKVCAFQQGTCQAKPSAQCTSSPSIAALKTINDNRSASTSALLTDPTLGPLANWICQ